MAPLADAAAVSTLPVEDQPHALRARPVSTTGARSAAFTIDSFTGHRARAVDRQPGGTKPPQYEVNAETDQWRRPAPGSESSAQTSGRQGVSRGIQRGLRANGAVGRLTCPKLTSAGTDLPIPLQSLPLRIRVSLNAPRCFFAWSRREGIHRSPHHRGRYLDLVSAVRIISGPRMRIRDCEGAVPVQVRRRLHRTHQGMRLPFGSQCA